MPRFENSRADLIERVLRVILRDWKSGTATGGNTTTIVDTSRGEADDYFQNTSPVSKAYIKSTTDGQAPRGESRWASDWVLSTGTLTVTAAYSVTLTAGDTYVITSEYDWTEVASAINMAIDIATSKNMLMEKQDESLVVEDDTYEYTLPEDFVYVYRVTQSNDDGDFMQPVPPDQYRIVRGGASPKLKFLEHPDEQLPTDMYVTEYWGPDNLTDGYYLRLEGLARQPQLDLDDDVCYLDPNFVCYQAAALLHSARIRRLENEPDDHRTQAQVCQAQANSYVRPTQLPPDSKKVTD